MARDTKSEKDQVTYRTFDNRAYTREAIESVFRSLEQRERNRERWERARTWVITAVVTIVLIAAFVLLLWWRVHTLH